MQMVCLVRTIRVPKCSGKNITYFFIFISAGILLHLYILKELVNLSDSVYLLSSIATRSKTKGIKYVLFWDTNTDMTPQNKPNGLDFRKLKCSVKKCLFTTDKSYLGDYSLFDAIIFSKNYLKTNIGRPARRTLKQLYIFTTIESSVLYPACEVFNDGFFNWTFTTRLDSDVVMKYFVVRNVNSTIVGPSTTVRWEKTNYAVDDKIRAIFKGRTKAAAWIVSHCGAESLRDEYLTRLQQHLFQYSLQLDVYGACNNVKCDNGDCERMLRENYYFYMAFENAIVEDYVTEKVLHGYDNYVVPIVYGGANYSRFLPPNSYINARNYHPYNLAKLIYNAVSKPAIYRTYFTWTNLYTINSEPYIYHPLCDLCEALCEALHSEKAAYAPVKENFRVWWNSLDGMKWCLSREFWSEKSIVNLDGKFINKNNLY